MSHTSVQRITFPFALNSEPWKIFTLVMDSIDFPSMGLITLEEEEVQNKRVITVTVCKGSNSFLSLSLTPC